MGTRSARPGVVRRLFVAALPGALASAMLAATPVAAANSITLTAVFGLCEFYGTAAGSNKSVKIEWRDAENRLKSKQQVASDATGFFISRCELGEIMETGDVIRTKVGASVRSFTVPKLTANVDRDMDTVSGKVDTTGLDLLFIEVDTFDGSFTADLAHESYPPFTPNTGIASYSTATWDVNPDIKGWDNAFAAWSNARGDMAVRRVVAEGMQVWARQPFIDFAGSAGQSISADLFTAPAGAVRGDAGGHLDPLGLLSTTFTNGDGETVRSAVGNQVEADFALDAELVIPNITVTINTAADRVRVDCNIVETGMTGVQVDLYNRDRSKFHRRSGEQHNASGGTFSTTFGNPRSNIRTGDKIDVYCKADTGDIVARTFTVN